jgi:hypothetical protein
MRWRAKLGVGICRWAITLTWWLSQLHLEHVGYFNSRIVEFQEAITAQWVRITRYVTGVIGQKWRDFEGEAALAGRREKCAKTRIRSVLGVIL